MTSRSFVNVMIYSNGKKQNISSCSSFECDKKLQLFFNAGLHTDQTKRERIVATIFWQIFFLQTFVKPTYSLSHNSCSCYCINTSTFRPPLYKFTLFKRFSLSVLTFCPPFSRTFLKLFSFAWRKPIMFAMLLNEHCPPSLAFTVCIRDFEKHNLGPIL